MEYNTDASATRKAEARRRELEEKATRLTSQVIGLELQLNIPQRWQPGDREYEETVKYIIERQYQQALGRLQRLVIQRLFELHKLNVSQTGTCVSSHALTRFSVSRKDSHRQEPPKAVQNHSHRCQAVQCRHRRTQSPPPTS